VRGAVKEEFDIFRKETESKFEGINADMEKAQTRIAVLEEWQLEAKSEMLTITPRTLSMQEKMTDLEGRSRRNNIRIFGIRGEFDKQVSGAFPNHRTRIAWRHLTPATESTQGPGTKNNLRTHPPDQW